MKLIRFLQEAAATAFAYVRIFGSRGIGHLLHCIFSSRKKVVRVAPHWSSHPLYVRLNSSDVSVFRQVFLAREYEITEQLAGAPATVVDAGANVGLSAVFLANLYPGSKIVAIEPDQSNYEMLVRNTQYFPSIHTVCAALWNRDGSVRISTPLAREWALKVEQCEPGDSAHPVSAVRLGTVLDRHGIQRLDLLKVDIEGAEVELFDDADAWRSRVDSIVIELHETLRPGCTELFHSALSDFDVVATGRELTLATRRNLKVAQ